MVMPGFARGFSLVELMITIAILALVMAMGVPLTRGWVANAHINHAENILVEGYSKARSIALKNPANITGSGNAAASLVIVGSTLSVQYTSAGVTTTEWSGSIDSDVTLALTDAACSNTLGLNNYGIATVEACLAYSIACSGGSSVTGELQ